MPAPLALLHGFTGAPASWLGDPGLLPRGARALAPGLLGHGGRAEAATSWDEEVDRLAAVIRGEARRAVVAGYSLGGRLALGIAVRHPDVVAALVLIGAQPGLASAEEREKRRADDESLALVLEREGLRAFLSRWESLPLFASQARLPPAKLEAQRAQRLAHDPRGLAASLRSTGLGAMPDLRPALPALRMPTFFLAGAEDEKFRRLSAEAAALVPGAEVQVAPGAGHNLLLEAGDLVRAALVRAGEAAG